MPFNDFNFNLNNNNINDNHINNNNDNNDVINIFHHLFQIQMLAIRRLDLFGDTRQHFFNDFYDEDINYSIDRNFGNLSKSANNEVFSYNI
jgi:hypothetical protein